MQEFLQYGQNDLSKKQAIFASIFVIQNRLQTACEKVQQEITMRQWLLLAMAEICDKPKTLSNIGRLMGCSRQNVKNLAAALENNCVAAVLKARSPSCGLGKIYDGTFKGVLTAGDGIFASLLKEKGVRIFTEENFSPDDI